MSQRDELVFSFTYTMCASEVRIGRWRWRSGVASILDVGVDLSFALGRLLLAWRERLQPTAVLDDAAADRIMAGVLAQLAPFQPTAADLTAAEAAAILDSTVWFQKLPDGRIFTASQPGGRS